MRRPAALVLFAIAVAAAALLGWFVLDPGRLPAGPDVAWYAWRTEMLTAHPPAELIRLEGPLRLFGGGYRVANPILGGLLRTAGGAGRSTVSIVFTAGWSLLAAVGVGAAAHRYRRDPRLFALAATFTAAMLLRPAFVGFVDSMLTLVLLTGALVLLPGARSSWGARGAVGLLVFASMFAHLPATMIFLGALAISGILGAVAGRSLRDALRSDGPALAAALAGALAGAAAWRLGVWGVRRPLGAALELAPFSREQFLQTADRWFGFLMPQVLLPLLLAGGFAVLWLGRGDAGTGRRLADDPLGRMALAWTLPVLGALGYLVGVRYPYHRFLNATLGHLLLGGIGLWALLLSLRAAARRLRGPAGGALTVAALLLPVGLVAVAGWAGLRSYDRLSPWVAPEVRAGSEAVGAYLRANPFEGPLVFTVSGEPGAPSDVTYARAFRGTWSRFRAGLPGEVLPATHMWFGQLEDFVAGRASATGDAVYDRLSLGTHLDVERATRARAPLVVVLDVLAPGARVVPPFRLVPLGGGANALIGPGLAEVRPGSYAPGPEPGGLGHGLRLALVLALLLAAPGIPLARRLGVRAPAEIAGLAPALSLAIAVVSGVVVMAVARRPLSGGIAWTVLAISVIAGTVAARALPAGEGGRGHEQRAERQSGAE